MKRIVLILMVLVSSRSFSQTADLTTGLPQLTDGSGREVKGSVLGSGEVVNLRIPVMNMNQQQAVRAGSCSLEIDLGDRLSVEGNLNGMSSLGDYFTWQAVRSAGGHLVMTGVLKAGLPADFWGTAAFKLKAEGAGVTAIVLRWVYASEKLRPSRARETTTLQVRISPVKGGSIAVSN